MREALPSAAVPEHLALAYTRWAPCGDDGKVPDDKLADWLSDLAETPIAKDYAEAFQRWQSSFRDCDAQSFELHLTGRLLIGHGNASATDVGLCVHHTWAVPMIPGSALKGLCAHYLETVYGPEDPARVPWEQPDGERERTPYQGATWKKGRIQMGPGEVYRALFGAPDAEQDDELRTHGLPAGASAGLVTFHDAVYVPGSSPEDKPFAADVLTVHQKGYYDGSGRTWPNDYDSPNPVSFLSVRPRIQLWFALSGPSEEVALAVRLLREALSQWGIGGKTSAGYGRLEASASPPPGPPPKPPASGDIVEAVLLEEKTKRGGWKARHESGLSGHILNSGDVPPGAAPGDSLTLTITAVTNASITFRYYGAGSGTKKKQTPKKRRKG